MNIEYNGITVSTVDSSGILISTPVNEFIFGIDELKWIYSTSAVQNLITTWQVNLEVL